MKWRKLGQIFNPKEHSLPNNCFEFAQSPQTLVFDDFIRIYFSTREKDETGKFLSHIAFADFDETFSKVLQISKHSIISLGNLGCYDEHGIFPINILRDDSKVWGYICGWHRKVSVSVDTSIGLAVSEDNGLTFKRIGEGPILTSSLNEPFLVGDPFVSKINGIYHMWYIYGEKWILDKNVSASPERVYKIAHATSQDGISWEKEGNKIIEDKLGSSECQALPTVIYHQNKYHMYFCYREAFDFRNNKNKSYRIGYAYSTDLLNWTRDDQNAGIEVSESGWDSEMLCYPHVFHYKGNLYILYNGNEFGRFGFGLAILEN